MAGVVGGFVDETLLVDMTFCFASLFALGNSANNG